MTTTFRRDAPVSSWAAGVKSGRRVSVRPTGIVAGAILVAAVLAALVVAGWGIKELSILWGAAAIAALAGVVVLTLRGFPLFAILTIIAGAVAWGAATRGRLPDSWFDILGVLGFIGTNLAFVVPLAGSFLAALLLDARRVARLSIDESVSGRRWWGKPDDHLPRLKELEAIPSARFFALGEGGCTHLVAAGRRVALFLPTVWPHGEFTMDAAGQVLRGGRLFVPGSEDVDGLAAEVHTWREQLTKIGGLVRGYLVVAPSRDDAAEDLVISVAPGEHLHLVHANEMTEAAGRWLAAEPYRVDLHVMERLLFLAEGNKLPEPLPSPRTFAREASDPSPGRTPTDAAFAAAAGEDPAPTAPVSPGATSTATPTTTWRPGNGTMRARLGRLARAGSAAKPDPLDDPAEQGAPDSPEAALPTNYDDIDPYGPPPSTEWPPPPSRRDAAPNSWDRAHDGSRSDAWETRSRDGRDGARADAWDASGPDAWDPSRPDARDSRRSDAWDAPRSDARDAGRSEAWDSGRSDARDPGRSEAWDSGRSDARDAGRSDAWDSGRSEAWDSSRPDRRDARRPDSWDDSRSDAFRAEAPRGDSDRNDFGRRDSPDPSDSGASDSWEARTTRELVGNWDNESASQIAAWAAEGGTPESAPGDAPRAGRGRADAERPSERLSWANSADDAAAGSDDRFRWSSAADDFPVTYEAGTWPSASSAPADDDAGARRRSWTEPGEAAVDSIGSGDTWRPAAGRASESRTPSQAPESWTPSAAPERPAASWTPAPASERAPESWTPGLASERPAASWTPAPASERASESWTPAPASERGPESWTPGLASERAPESWTPGLASERATASWTPAPAPERAAEPWTSAAASERGSEASGLSGERGTEAWASGSSGERGTEAWAAGSVGEPRGDAWTPAAGAEGRVDPWTASAAEASGSGRGSAEPGGESWRGSYAGAGERESRGASAAPGRESWPTSPAPGRESWGGSAAAERPQEPTRDVGRRRPEDLPVAGQRPSWGGSLFDKDAPELVAQPLELRRSWDSDPESRSVRRRDRAEQDMAPQDRAAPDRGGPDQAAQAQGRAVQDRGPDGWGPQERAPQERGQQGWGQPDRGSQDWGQQDRGQQDWRGQQDRGQQDWRGQQGRGQQERPQQDGGQQDWRGQQERPRQDQGQQGWAQQERGQQDRTRQSGQAMERDQPTTAWASVPSNRDPGGRGPRDDAAADRERMAGERDRAFGDRGGYRAGAGGEGRTEAWPRGSEAREQPAGAPPEDAWWDAPPGAQPQPGESAEKPKRSRWGRNKDKDKDKDAAKGRVPDAPAGDDWAAGAAERGEWATEPTSRWDRNADRDGVGAGADHNRRGPQGPAGYPQAGYPQAGQPQPGQPQAGQPAFGGQAGRGGEDSWDRGGAGTGERIPEQRKRDAGAFDDLAPLELNLDEEPKAEKSRRFLRRK
ncbi:hypothetical protein [Dactylosporangium sp. CA-139066]|uniref:hypothetical protein n=1 Tax=Dactylosporangium sp. CA-139066 TaxID=3239930 RepID=UPI003D8FB3BD